MKIIVTKVASAHFDIEVNTAVEIRADSVLKVVSVPRGVEIGRAVIFLNDGSNINIAESAEHVNALLDSKPTDWFQFGFSKN